MRNGRRVAGLVLALLLPAALLAACGDGEDRPGQVSSEGGSGSASGSASASGTGSASGSGSGTHAGEHSGSGGADFTKDEADVAIDVTATEFKFEGIPATITGEKIFFTVENAGSVDHEFDVKGHGAIEPFEAGETETLAVELEPGEYEVICLVKEGDQTHEELGMTATFTVAE